MNRIIDIGTKKLEVFKKGNGDIKVVIELGIGTHFDDWSIIIEELSKNYTVFTYHRAGYGNSSLGAEKRTTGQIAKELNILLKEVGIEKNIVLIGHSFGGLCVQHFAKIYPEKIIGMLLVDPNTINQKELEELPIIKERFSMGKTIENWNRLSQKTKEEITKEINPTLTAEQKKLSKESQEKIIDFLVLPQTYKTMALEYESFNESVNDIKDFEGFSQIPLTVMVRDKELMISNLIKIGIKKEEAIIMENTWHKIVKETTRLSNKGRCVEIKNATHCIYRCNPENIIKEVDNLICEIEKTNEEFEKHSLMLLAHSLMK